LKKTVKIDVCIASYKRPSELAVLLSSLAQQRLDDSISMRVIVIDNDPERSAKNAFDAFARNVSISCIYDTQPEKNISLTRNKALSYATSEYIAFVDDDEWVEEGWLNALLSTSIIYDADIVFGPVFKQIPEGSPRWVISGGFFDNKVTLGTGSLVTHGATNNVLIRSSPKMRPLLKFDRNYGLTGGEDTELFSRLYSNGFRLVWCREAIVYEKVTSDRMTVRSLSMRSFSGGQSHVRIHRIRQSKFAYVIKTLERFFTVILLCAILPFSIFLGRARWVWVLTKLMSRSGQLSVLFTRTFFQEYK
jgi:succinoglycan biosynthesis protein ExoM